MIKWFKYQFRVNSIGDVNEKIILLQIFSYKNHFLKQREFHTKFVGFCKTYRFSSTFQKYPILLSELKP